MKPGSTFCIYPWDHLATLTNGDIIPCCVAENNNKLNLNNQTFTEAWNSPTMKDIRKQMMKDEIPQACRRCFVEEQAGIESHRIQSNNHMMNVLGTFEELLSKTDETGFYSGPIKSVDLRLGNNCNLKCVMCRPNESSKWAADISKVIENTHNDSVVLDLKWKSNINKKSYSWFKNSNFWEIFYKMVPDMREIIIGGGEPFLIPEQNQFLKECVTRGISKNLKIRYHTNGTILPDEILEAFKHFKKIEVMVSLDGVDEKNHYMRFPAQWQSINTTLKKLDETPENVTVYLLSSMHVMSLFYFPELIRWVIAQNFKKVAISNSYSNLPATGIVHHPSYINPQILPAKIKGLIRSKYKELYNVDFENYFVNQPELKKLAIQRLNANLDYMEANDTSCDLNQFQGYVAGLDKARNTNFSSCFPELATLLDMIN